MYVIFYLYFIIFLAVLLLSWMIYVIISKTIKNKKIKKEIVELFNAQEYEGALKFEYRGYTMLATFRPDIKISISHNKEIVDIKAPKGMNLTPMFLIIKIKKREEIRDLVDKAVNFLNSIPTQ